MLSSRVPAAAGELVRWLVTIRYSQPFLGIREKPQFIGYWPTFGAALLRASVTSTEAILPD
jgi:hypothetical protein